MNPLIFVILIIMVIFTIYNFWQDISDFWNTGTFVEGMTGNQKVPEKGTFISNEGRKWEDQKPFKVSENIYVFGGKDGGWFKMASVDSNGIFIENRYTNACNSIEDLTIDIWNSANKGGDYRVEDIILKSIPVGAKGNPIKIVSATQAKTSHNGVASRIVRALDFTDWNDRWPGGKCTHTDPSSWLKAVLDGRYAVKEVQLLNRRDCCSERLKNAKVYVLDGEKKHLCGTVDVPDDTHTDLNTGWFTVKCPAEAVGNTIEVSTEDTGKHLTICGMKVFGVAPTPPTAAAAGTDTSADAGSGNIELNQPLTNNYAVGTNVQATSSAPRNNVVTTTDDKGNTITTTTQESNRVDANTGAQIQEKCITVSQLHSASQWVDHLFQTLGGTKCANKDKVATAKNASKMDFIAGVIKGYQKDTAGSHESYMTAINKAQPHLSQAFSGDNLKGEDNNLAQSTTEQISNNSADTQAPVTNDIQAPQQPTWQDDQMAQQFSQQQPPQPPQQPQMINGQILPNGFIVEQGSGQCPNGCKYPQYDNKSCEDTIFNGKQYRKCPWVKDGLNGGDCTSCGAILMPKNEHGYARTAPGLFDNVSLEMALKTTDIKGGDGDYYNIGKNFMAQLSKTKHFNLPNTIEPNEYISIGKLIHKYQTERTESSKNTLTNFINDILVTVSLSKDRKINNNSMITAHVAKGGGNFDIDRKKLTGKGVYAYEDAERELASNNRLGGSKSLYEKHISDRARKANGIPRDPRRHPNPYNSLWNVFKY